QLARRSPYCNACSIVNVFLAACTWERRPINIENEVMTHRSRPDSALSRRSGRFMPQSLTKFLAFCLFFSTLAVALSEDALGYTLARPAQQPAQAPRDAGNKVDDEKEAPLLEPGKAIKRELSGAGSHTYRIRLAADQFLKVVIEQDGIDVVARLVGP